MEYYFFLDILYIFHHYILMVFTFSTRQLISLHFAKKKCMKIDQVRAENLHLAKHCGGQNQKWHAELIFWNFSWPNDLFVYYNSKCCFEFVIGQNMLILVYSN